MKYAWVENGFIHDIAHETPADIYHPDVAVLYSTLVSDDAANGDRWVDGQLIKAPSLPDPEPPARTWFTNDIRKNLSLVERVKWDADSSDFIKTAKIEFGQSPQIEHTTEVLQMLVDAGDITQASMAKILA